MSENGGVSKPEVDQVTVRRAPRFPAFLIGGGGLGAVVTLVLTAIFPTDQAVGFVALFGYFSLFGIPGGVLLGAVLAIALDRRSTRRAKTVAVEVTAEADGLS